MKIEKGIPVPDNIRGRSIKYDFKAMEIGDSFFTAGAASIQISILTCAKRYKPKRFVTKKTIKNGKKGYRCWRVK